MVGNKYRTQEVRGETDVSMGKRGKTCNFFKIHVRCGNATYEMIFK